LEGSFFCFWHSDKVLIQHELARSLSQLQHGLKDFDLSILWLDSFWKTMVREWSNIDRFRIEKFYSFLRYTINESFVLLINNKWSEECIAKYTSMLKHGPLNARDSSIPKGVIYHLCDIYIEELVKTQNNEPFFNLDVKIFSKLLSPFLYLLTNGDKMVLKRLSESILIPIAEGWKDDINEIFGEDSEEPPNEEDFEMLKKLYQHVDTFTDFTLKLALNKNTQEGNRSTIYKIKDTFSNSLDFLKNILSKNENELPKPVYLEVEEEELFDNNTDNNENNNENQNHSNGEEEKKKQRRKLKRRAKSDNIENEQNETTEETNDKKNNENQTTTQKNKQGKKRKRKSGKQNEENGNKDKQNEENGNNTEQDTDNSKGKRPLKKRKKNNNKT